MSTIQNLLTNPDLPLNHRLSQIKRVCIEEFYPLDYLETEQLDYLKLLRWSGSWLRTQIRYGQIFRDNIPFNVVWYRCTPTEAYASGQCSLSFRIALDSNGNPLTPYVLIRAH